MISVSHWGLYEEPPKEREERHWLFAHLWDENGKLRPPNKQVKKAADDH